MALRTMPVALALALALAACHTPARRLQQASDIASGAGLAPLSIPAGPFTLVGWQRPGSPPGGPAGAHQPLTLYIEGDGHAWLSRHQISADPTPLEPVALRLAARHPGPVVYLARPCQFTGEPRPAICRDARWWSSHRFAPEVLAAYGQALDQLKAASHASRLHLVGYSGGGALAALLAAQRTDVASLRSVAGNLDHAALHAHHRVAPTPQSLNPADHAARLATVPQLHFVGLRDQTVPASIARGFIERQPTGACARLVPVDADHHRGWDAAWPALLAQPLPCASGLP